jgi:hypothetical protein
MFAETPPGLFMTITILTSLYFIIKQLDSRQKNHFHWLKIYEESEEIGDIDGLNNDREYEENDVFLFWKRVRITMRINMFMIYHSRMIFMTLAPYFIYASSRKEYYFPYSLINSLLIFTVCFTSMSVIFTSMIVFYHVCYHLSIQFNLIFKKMIEFKKTQKQHTNIGSRSRELLKLLREHNEVCLDLVRFNNFWNVFLAIKCVLCPLAIQLCIYISFLTPAKIPARIAFFTGVIKFTLCLSSVCLSASMANKKARSCYSLMNQISLSTQLSLHVKIKLNNYIQRLDGKNLAFTCFNLFNITYGNYFKVSLIDF